MKAGFAQRLLPAVTVVLLSACSSAVRWEDPGPRTVPRQMPPATPSRPAARPAFHTVQAGETLYAISFRYGLSVQTLAAWNGLGDGTLIRIGQRLRPCKTEFTRPGVPWSVMLAAQFWPCLFGKAGLISSRDFLPPSCSANHFHP